MIFTEARFLVFFAIAFGVHWMMRWHTGRKLWLLLCSYAFYAAWDWRFLSLIAASTLVDYVVGIRLGALTTEQTRARRVWLFISLLFNLGLLGVFKYYHFFMDSAVTILNNLGIGAEPSTLQIILPVGISFYTFQTMSYSLDIYFGCLKPTRNLLDLALFVGFFPQLVAGPIVRAREFLPQIRVPRLFSRIDVRACVVLFLIGFFKKACVSDNIAPIVDTYFADPASFDVLSAWLAVLFYGAQIYCDFSGYSDIAIASAGLLGYNLGDNFAFPYFASSIQDFWHRWHISLSSWLRDYLYIPLGGSRGSTLYRYRNLMLTMLLGGLWHGAAWRFVIWGGLHGLALIVHREWTARAPEAFRMHVAWRGTGVLITAIWVGLAWIFFRAPSLDAALTTAGAYAFGRSSGTETLPVSLIALLMFILLLHAIAYHRVFRPAWRGAPTWMFAGGVGIGVAIITAFAATEAAPFIYFQF